MIDHVRNTDVDQLSLQHGALHESRLPAGRVAPGRRLCHDEQQKLATSKQWMTVLHCIAWHAKCESICLLPPRDAVTSASPRKRRSTDCRTEMRGTLLWEAACLTRPALRTTHLCTLLTAHDG